MKLSILIPVYNERTVVSRSLSLVMQAPLPENIERELIIVDDSSTDGTYNILQEIAAENPCIKLYRHEKNQGKGAAVRTCIGYATGDFCLIQDADLEYDPNEYPRLLQPLLDGRADAVFGSRYMAGSQRRILPFWHSMINKFLTLMSNMFSNVAVTDMETCYKVFRTDLLQSIPIRSNRFGFEPEITMKCAKRKLRIYEVPISYHGRTYEEGKKIGWKDGLKVFGVILHFWVVDDLYTQPHGRGLQNNQYGTPHYLAWIARLLRPHLRDSVFELGAGLGNLTGRLMSKRAYYVAAEHDTMYLHSLQNRFLRTPNVEVKDVAPEGDSAWGQVHDFESALCINMLEYVDQPEAVLQNMRHSLAPGGTLAVLVPQSRDLYGSVDRSLGLQRRFDRDEIVGMIERSGFRITKVYDLNKVGRPGWWLASKVMGRQQVSKLSLKVFDWSVWFWRLVDGVLPWKGLSLVLIATRAD